jgi:hypothetical protein
VVEDGKEELYEKESQTANTKGTMGEREKES